MVRARERRVTDQPETLVYSPTRGHAISRSCGGQNAHFDAQSRGNGNDR